MAAGLERAIEIAHQAHEGQTRYDGSPYVRHPLRVMGRLAAAGYSEHAQIVGVLHDVVEDSDWTIEQLREEGFDEEVLEAVDLMTKKPEQDEAEYLDGLAHHEIARPVKEFDMDDNLSDNPTKRQVEKYRRRLAYLATLPAGV